MSIFKLPDLGEGLPDAEIVEWHVKVGDTIALDQPLVSMETAKAVVEVPSPQAGTITKLYGGAGDIIKTGAPLVEFEGAAVQDTGTVVGKIESTGRVEVDDFIIGRQSTARQGAAKATPAVRALARELGVDLSQINGSGHQGLITADDVRAAGSSSNTVAEGYTPLRGVRRAMVATMTQSHQQIVPVTIYDDADIQHWTASDDITVRLIQAVCDAAKTEPALNAWYDGQSVARKLHNSVNLGLAMDTPDGLFVPVIHDAQEQSPAELRKIIDEYKKTVTDRSIAQDKLHGASITLSNFGKFAGRYASPIIVPPMVAIIAVGRLRDELVPVNGEAQIHRKLPLSVSFDHRAVTGGEATRFLGAMIQSLEH